MKWIKKVLLFLILYIPIPTIFFRVFLERVENVARNSLTNTDGAAIRVQQSVMEDLKRARLPLTADYVKEFTTAYAEFVAEVRRQLPSYVCTWAEFEKLYYAPIMTGAWLDDPNAPAKSTQVRA